MKVNRSYNVQIWLGLKETKGTGKVHTIDNVRNICNIWCNEIKDCVSITPTEFHYVDGWEVGVIVGYIAYPRFFKSRKAIRKKALALAEKLMIAFKQEKGNRYHPL